MLLAERAEVSIASPRHRSFTSFRMTCYWRNGRKYLSPHHSLLCRDEEPTHAGKHLIPGIGNFCYGTEALFAPRRWGSHNMGRDSDVDLHCRQVALRHPVQVHRNNWKFIDRKGCAR